jgi:hypothetical protein
VITKYILIKTYYHTTSKEALENQAINIVAGAVGNVGAKRIGLAYHKPDGITKTKQLLLHAGLGAGTSAITGNDPLNGAVSGVVGEVVGEKLRDTGVSKKTGSELAGLAGGLSSIFTGNAVGLDDSEVADSIFAGQRIGKNAAKYNAYFALRPLKSEHKRVSKILSKIESNILDKNDIELAHEQLFFEDNKGGNIGFFDDNTLHEESGEILNIYRKTKTDFNDDLMRQAVSNISNKTTPYDLLGFDTDFNKYNCQDWASEVRQEYYRLENQQKINIWNSIKNNN